MTFFRLNGNEVEVSDGHPHLLAALREELGVLSPKDGCSPSGQCGCCTVLLDGKPLVSCQVGLDRAAGKDVTTVEGLDEGERTRFAEAFAATGALQCGFCTPGIVMRSKALLEKKGASLTRDDAARHLGLDLHFPHRSPFPSPARPMQPAAKLAITDSPSRECGAIEAGAPPGGTHELEARTR